MNDLIYVNNQNDYKEIKQIIELKYPDAVIEDASDCIHTYRFSVDFESEFDDWILFILKNHFAMCSMVFQLKARTDPDKIKELVDKVT